MAMAKAMAMLASRRAKHDVTHTHGTHTHWRHTRRRKSMKNVDSSPSHTDSRTHTITAHRQGLCEPETRRRTRTTHANARWGFSHTLLLLLLLCFARFPKSLAICTARVFIALSLLWSNFVAAAVLLLLLLFSACGVFVGFVAAAADAAAAAAWRRLFA